MHLETRDAFLERVDPIIIKQAHRQHKGSEILEVDDIAQEVRLHFIEKYQHLKGLADDSISYIAYRAAATYCEKEREDYMYQSGSFVYFGELVEYLLRNHAFADLDGDTDVEGRVDVQAAIDNLTPRQREVTLKRYRDDVMLTASERDVMSDALRRMTSYLNRGINKSRVELASASEMV